MTAVVTRRGALGGAAATGFAGGARAQAFPARAIRVVVPFGPGGGTDNLMRLIEAPAARNLGQQLVIENRPGGGGSIGADLVAKAEPDGYTLLVTDSSFAINPTLLPRLPFDPVRDFAPVSLLASGPVILLAHPGLPVRSIIELVALAKARPGTLSYASGGNGASTHLAGELLKSEAGIELTHIPYRGTGPATNDVVGGHVPLMFNGISAARGHVLDGRLRALAVTGAARSPALPDVPTFAEAGLPGVEASSFWGALTRAGTPESAVNRLAEALNQAVRTPELQPRLQDLGFTPIGGGPAAYAANLASETAKWARVIRAGNIRPD